MNRYAVYRNSSRTVIIKSTDGGKTFEDYTVDKDSACHVVDALNAWHDEETAVEQLHEQLEK